MMDISIFLSSLLRTFAKQKGDKIILNIPDVIRTGIMLYNMNPEARPHTQYDN